MNIRAAGILLLAALLPSADGQEVWRQVSAEGDVRYSDRPFAGAEAVPLRAPLPWAAAPLPARRHDGGDTASPRAVAGEVPELAILRPSPEETVRAAGGELLVTLAGGFAAPEGGRLVLELDGAEAAWRGEPPELILKEVWRGEHRLRARLLDVRGRELASSPEVRFYKREPSAIRSAPDPPGG